MLPADAAAEAHATKDRRRSNPKEDGLDPGDQKTLDVSKLLLPYEPTDIATELAARKAADPAFPIEQVHLFPLGGIKSCAEWAATHGGTATLPAARAV